MEKNIYLTGFMGCGKSTVGPALASSIGRLFVDLDRMIESKAGMAVALVFSTQGEAAFRKLETEALKECAALGDRVVALGGGAVLREENREIIRGSGKLVYLKASFEVLATRLKRGKARRPLIADASDVEIEDRIRAMMKDRSPIYEKSDLTIDCDDSNAAKIAKEIATELGVTG